MTSKLIKVGLITASHGVRGQVKLRSFTEEPADLLSYTPLTDSTGKRQFKFTSQGIKGDSLIVSIEGIADRNASDLLKNTAIYAPASALPEKEEGTWYSSDLIGLEARTPDGKAYGSITAVHNYGAGDIIELELVSGGNEMLPFKAPFVGEIYVDKGYVEVTPPEYIGEKD